MSLSNAVVKTGATVAPTGGTDLTFASRGTKDGSNVLYVNADADSRTRRTITCSVKDAKTSVMAPNGMTQQRCQFVFKSPLTLDNGLVTVNKVSIEFAYDVETSDAEIEELRIIAAQICSDSDFSDAVKRLSLL